MRKIVQVVVAFSEKLNFTQLYVLQWKIICQIVQKFDEPEFGEPVEPEVTRKS